MKTIVYRVVNESWDRARKAQHVNRGSCVLLKLADVDYVLPIGAGDSDHVDVFQEGSLLFVVSVNHGLEYAGLEVFDTTLSEQSKFSRRMEASQVGQVFLQSDYEIDDILGKRGTDLHPRNIAKRLSEYAMS